HDERGDAKQSDGQKPDKVFHSYKRFCLTRRLACRAKNGKAVNFPGWQISFGQGLLRKNKPHELQHRSHEMDKDHGEEGPKPVQHGNVVKLKQKRGDSDPEQWIKQDLGYAFIFIWTKVTRRSEICDRKRHNENCGKCTAPSPDGIRCWLYRQEQHSKQRISERKNRITEKQSKAKPIHARPLVYRFRNKAHHKAREPSERHRHLSGDTESLIRFHASGIKDGTFAAIKSQSRRWLEANGSGLRFGTMRFALPLTNG